VKIPDNLKYTKEHEWLKADGDTVTVGITDYAQGELGDVVFVELPAEGTEVKAMDTFGTIEAVKAVSDLYAPVSGKIVEKNKTLDDDPMTVNRDPYGDGWMVRIEISDKSELDNLLSAEDYKKQVE